MGIVLPQTVKVRVAGGKNKYYENKGYGNGKKMKLIHPKGCIFRELF